MPPPIATEICPAALARARQRANVPWCRDYELMISGARYSAYAPELIASRAAARVFMHEYAATNARATDPGMQLQREEMLRGQLGAVGKGVFVEPTLSFDYGCNITLGDNVYANFG